MGEFEINRALYVSVCKDNDQIYTERVRFDKEVFESLKQRAHRIISSDRMPEPLSADPTWFECKFCSAHDLCHKSHTMKPQDVTCRSCSHITFHRDGATTCAQYECEIPKEAQQAGCEAHILHPDLVPWTMDIQDGKVYWIIDGKPVCNGEPDASVFSSKEILSNPKACANPDKFMTDVRVEMNGRISNGL